MNNDKFQKGISDIKAVTMTSEEKRVMAQDIFSTQDVHAVVPRAIPSRFFKSSPFKSYRSLSMAFASLFVLILGGASVFSASNIALPGDTLYPLKTNVTEPIRDVFAPTPEAFAELQTEKIDRRLEEAKLLVEEKKMTPKKAAQIEQLITRHSKKFNVAVDTLRSTSTAETISASFEKNVEAGAEKLENISEHASNTPSYSVSESARKAVRASEKARKDKKNNRSEKKERRGK